LFGFPLAKANLLNNSQKFSRKIVVCRTPRNHQLLQWRTTGLEPTEEIAFKLGRVKKWKKRNFARSKKSEIEQKFGEIGSHATSSHAAVGHYFSHPHLHSVIKQIIVLIIHSSNQLKITGFRFQFYWPHS
jgi:hypothetical protein